MGNVDIFPNADVLKLKNPLIILGFPGTGLVGSVAASQIVESLNMKFGGHISSDDFAPLAAIHNYTPLPAARIHYSEEHNLVVMLSEMSIPVNSSFSLAEKVFGLAKKLSAKSIVSLGGISLKEDKSESVYIISSDEKLIKDAIAKKIAKPIKEGATTGVSGILLTRGTLENYPVTTILAESSEEYMDPRAATTVIKTLSKITGININTSSLEKDAKELSKSLKDAIIKAKVSKRKGPSADEGGTMYG